MFALAVPRGLQEFAFSALIKRILPSALPGLLLLSGPTLAQTTPTLELVKTRGQLICGVNGQQPSFSFLNAVKEWEGLDVDVCRAVAAAVLGDAKRVKFVPLPPQQRFDALRSGAIDLLVANATNTLQGQADGLQFTVANYYDVQAVVVAKELGIAHVAALRGSKICVLRGTAHEANLVNWFGARRLSIVPLRFDDQNAMYGAFVAGRCDAVTEGSTALAASILRRAKAADYMMLPEPIAKEALGPFVRRGDEAWHAVVKWTQYAMIEAEELGLTGRTASRFYETHDPMVLRIVGETAAGDGGLEARLQSLEPRVRRLLGVTPGNGKALGLDEAWAYDIIKQVGNYGESYERNIGSGSPLRYGRGLNALWNRGGLMYAMPLQ